VAEGRSNRQGREAVLTLLRDAPTPLSVAQIADPVGLHVNTVRGHLELLVHLGVITRQTEHAGGRGRPRVLYQMAEDDAPPRDAYRTLAAVLANELSILGGSDQTTADEAGRLWATALLAEGRLQPMESDDGAIQQTTALFTELGFDAVTEPLGDRIYLRACPYAAIRDAFPAVCETHLALMRGTLAVTTGRMTVKNFEVDARPGLCVAHLTQDPHPITEESS
jgi:predicted ArsR family transcriptional regulator